MGKSIIKVSVSSWKTLILLYGKMATLLFALFCVATGQTIKTTTSGNVAGSTRILKGKALLASDFSLLKNIKLYLCTVAYPVYGMSNCRGFGKIDSTTSDNNGNFTIASVPVTSNTLAINTTVIDKNAKTIDCFSQTIAYTPGKDTIYTFYLGPNICTSTIAPPAEVPANRLYIARGNKVTLKVPEWAAGIKSVSVVNIQGETITDLQLEPDGTIHWNTQLTVKGAYFLTIKNSNDNMTVKIVVQ